MCYCIVFYMDTSLREHDGWNDAARNMLVLSPLAFHRPAQPTKRQIQMLLGDRCFGFLGMKNGIPWLGNDYRLETTKLDKLLGRYGLL